MQELMAYILHLTGININSKEAGRPGQILGDDP
jgi:hypothetical protein